MLQKYFKEKGVAVYATKEPGGTRVGEIFRKLLISKEYDIEPFTELLLYVCDRLELQKKVILPKLKENINIISDRFLSSTYAYQIFGRKLQKEVLDFLTKLSVETFPDFTFIIDIDPEIALKRAINRLKKENLHFYEGKFEALDVNFFEDVRKGFLWYAKNFKNCFLIDGSDSSLNIHKKIVSILKV